VQILAFKYALTSYTHGKLWILCFSSCYSATVYLPNWETSWIILSLIIFQVPWYFIDQGFISSDQWGTALCFRNLLTGCIMNNICIYTHTCPMVQYKYQLYSQTNSTYFTSTFHTVLWKDFWPFLVGAHGSVVGWDTILQARRSQIWVLMR
jgi:hypothetical protein